MSPAKPLALLALPLLAACQPTATPLPEVFPTYRTEFNNLVLGDAVTPGQFEVIRRSGDHTTEMWCAAGQYVRYALGQPTTTRVYVAKPMSESVRQPGEKSVIFTVAPTEEMLNFERPQNDYSLTVSRVGESMPVAGALQICNEIPLYFWTDFF